MSSFRPKVKPVDGRRITRAYEQRTTTRMLRNGATLQHARSAIIDKYRARQAKRDQRENG